MDTYKKNNVVRKYASRSWVNVKQSLITNTLSTVLLGRHSDIMRAGKDSKELTTQTGLSECKHRGSELNLSAETKMEVSTVSSWRKVYRS